MQNVLSICHYDVTWFQQTILNWFFNDENHVKNIHIIIATAIDAKVYNTKLKVTENYPGLNNLNNKIKKLPTDYAFIYTPNINKENPKPPINSSINSVSFHLIVSKSLPDKQAGPRCKFRSVTDMQKCR